MKGKALRDSDTEYTRDGRNEESSRLRVDELSVEKLRESHETTQKLTSQMQSLQEQMNSMSDAGEFQELGSNHGGRLSHVPSPPAAIPCSRSMRSCDKRLPLDTWNMSGPQENAFGDQFSSFVSSRNHCQGIHHSTTPGATGSVPVHVGTGTPVARVEDQNRDTVPMPTFARRPSTMSSSLPVEIPQNSTVGLQRQQIIGTPIR